MARKLLVEIIGDSKSLERAFGQAAGAAQTFGDKLKSAGSSITSAGKRLTLGVTLPLAAFGAASFKAANDFETSMSRVVGLAGQSQKQVDAWSKDLLRLGPALGKSPRELAEALYFVASSGVPAGKVLSVVTAAAKASTAGMGETEVVADALTSAMNAYGAANMSAARATDVLVATVREGKGEAADFAPVIGNVTAYASRLGVSFEEVGAALAAMTQLGTDAATASTQLQAFFSQVLKPSDKAEKAIKKVGLSFEQLQTSLQTKGLLPTLNLIKEAFKGNTVAMAQSFPNIRALRALLALTAEDGGKVAGVFKRLGESAGSLGVAFDAATKRSGFSMEKFFASIEALKIVIGTTLQPIVTKLAGWLTEISIAFQRLNPETRKWIITISAIAAAIGPVLVILGSLVSAVGVLAGPLAAIAVAIGAVVAAVVLAGVAPDQLAGGLQALGLSASRAEAFIKPLAAAFGLVRGAVEMLIPVIRTIASLAMSAGFASWGPPLIAAASAMYIAHAALGVLTTAFVTLRGAMAAAAAANMASMFTALLSPVNLTVIAIGALTAAYIVSRNASDVLGDSLNRQREALKALKDVANEAVSSQDRLRDAKIGLKQATLNVSNAIRQRNEIEAAGKKGTDEYKQAQLSVQQAYALRIRGEHELSSAQTGNTESTNKQAAAIRHMSETSEDLRGRVSKLTRVLSGWGKEAEKHQTVAAYAREMQRMAAQADKVAEATGKSNPKVAAAATHFAESARQAAAYAKRTGEIPSALAAVAPAAESAGKRVGASFGAGIERGISSMTGAIASAAAHSVRAAEQAARSEAKAKSPSELFAALGRDLGEGLSKGFKEKYAQLSKSGQEAVDKMIAGALSAITNARGVFSTAFDSLVSQALSAFDRLSQESETKTEKKLRLMDERAEARARKQAVVEGRAGVAQAAVEQQALRPEDFATFDEYLAAVVEAGQKRKEAQRQLNEALAAQQRFQLEQEAERERKAYEQKRERQRYHLERELTAAATAYERGKIKFRELQERILGIMREYEVPFKKGAAALGFQLAQGLQDAFEDVRKAAKALAQEIITQLSKIRVIINVDLSVKNEKPKGRQHGGLVSAGAPYIVGEAGPELFIPRNSGRIIPSASGRSPAAGITVNVYNAGSVISERDLVDSIHNGLLARQRRIGALGFS